MGNELVLRVKTVLFDLDGTIFDITERDGLAAKPNSLAIVASSSNVDSQTIFFFFVSSELGPR